MKNPLLIALLAALAPTTACIATESTPATTDVYVGTGKAPNHTYRIPTMCLTKGGAILLFAEKRKNHEHDNGDIDTVARRSEDGGKTWGKETVVADMDKYTFGNICPIVDPKTGRITALLDWNKMHEYHQKPGFGEDSRRIYVIHSDDDGKTWSRPENITEQIKKTDWVWFANGPGTGFVKQFEPHKGRYIAPANHSQVEQVRNKKTGKDETKNIYYAHAVYSDDAGKTWKSSESYAARHTNECEIVELANGDLMLNMRNHGSAKKQRAVAVSKDGGETWGETTWDATLPEPQCMGSIMRHTLPTNAKPGLILFSNPANDKGRDRINLTLRASKDEGKTWTKSLVIDPGKAAYSHLVVLKDGTIGIAYEADDYKRIVFRTVKPSELK